MTDGVFRIQSGPIAPGDLHEAVLRDADGAVATFAGVVRDNSQGRATQYLEYDAYAGMAEKKLAEVGEEIRARWDVDQVAILHRVGRLKIGDISVLIAVSAAHRGAALEGCAYAIDRLKEVVPIWKKEVWTDGEAWIEGDRPVQGGDA